MGYAVVFLILVVLERSGLGLPVSLAMALGFVVAGEVNYRKMWVVFLGSLIMDLVFLQLVGLTGLLLFLAMGIETYLELKLEVRSWGSRVLMSGMVLLVYNFAHDKGWPWWYFLVGLLMVIGWLRIFSVGLTRKKGVVVRSW